MLMCRNLRLFIYIISPILVETSLIDLQYAHLDTNMLQKSQESYDTLARIAKTNSCVQKALEKLTVNCKTMDDDAQSRLALELTNCQLEKFGKQTYKCDLSMKFKDCVKDIDENILSSYNTFYTHADNVCFFHRSIMWSEHAEEIINKLMYLSSGLSKTMNDNLQTTKDMYTLQTETADGMKNSLKLHLKTLHELNESASNFKNLNEEIMGGFSRVIDNMKMQGQDVLDIFEKIYGELRFIKELQMWLVYECFDFRSLFFYLLLFLAIGFITSHRRYAESKQSFELNDFEALLLNYFVEKVTYDILKVSSLSANERNQIFQLFVKYERLLFLLFCFKTLFDQHKNYIDFNKQILMEVQLLREQTIYDSPKIKQKIQSQLLSLLKNSFTKFRFSKLKNWSISKDNQKPAICENEPTDDVDDVRKKLVFE